MLRTQSKRFEYEAINELSVFVQDLCPAVVHDVPVDVTAGAALRWSRAALLAVVAMGSGVVGHVSAGGLMPGQVALSVLFALCLLTAAALLGRPASTLRVVLLVVAGQTLIHGTLTAMSGHKGDPPLSRSPLPQPPVSGVPTGDGRRVGSLYDQVYANQSGAARTELTVPAPVQHLLADLTGPHAAMALAHLLAAVLVGLWLARGEQALWQLLAFAAHGVRDLLVRTLVSHYDRLTGLARVGHDGVPLRPAPEAWRHTKPARIALLARSVVRRGPPALLTA